MGRLNPVQLRLIDADVAEEAFKMRRKVHPSIMRGPRKWCQAEVLTLITPNYY